MQTIINKLYVSEFGLSEISHLSCFFSRTKEEGFLTLMIKSISSDNISPSYANKFLTLKCNTQLEISSVNIGSYHILSFVDNDRNLESDFRRISNYLFVEKNNPARSEDILKLFYSLQNLFSSEEVKESHSLQIGYYGEFISLLKMIQVNKGELLSKWHLDYKTKHDFEINNYTRIEVKTTTNSVRIHNFAHDQISRNNIKVYVISNILEISEKGTSFYELSLMVLSKMEDYKQKLSIEKIMKICGVSKHNQGIICNIDDCLEKCKLYEDISVPKLESIDINGISNIRYDIDFSSVSESNFSVL